ncbi:PREDICTED: 15-hydroxyprostaglandin dehydrogenase [NAD(+)]-like [Nicrophorus vespilloides]|uniref:15-hydroxyprostaglandin dehydrogenase [NAD(+)]-like n=1 Tax=Nicrophorus vespilloides TaxID=110193 RepID=A0ABM1M4D2_NICVS|nr:PREDICTED: 15-hydroxyprostaglandin dehydrogenase [NAD(+)]-like [Nicrophorus vespilloides]
MDFSDKVALVTGGASGLGLECVKCLLKQNIKGVTIADLNPSGIEVAKELGSKVLFTKVDVTDEKQFQECMKNSMETFGGLDILVNNAGISCGVNWEKAISVNATAVARCTFLAMEVMRKDMGGNGGMIVNTSSILGLRSTCIAPIYAATKSFVVSFTRSMGTDYFHKKTGVKVLCIAPGFTITPLTTDVPEPYTNFEDMQDNVLNVLKKQIFQQPDVVGQAFIDVMNSGKNGSVWVIRDNLPLYEQEPQFENLVD